MLRAARKRRFSFADLKALGPSRRRQVHDDITVVVLFFDSQSDGSQGQAGGQGEGASALATLGGPGKPRRIGQLSVRSLQPLPRTPEAEAEGEEGGEEGKEGCAADAGGVGEEDVPDDFEVDEKRPVMAKSRSMSSLFAL